MHTFKSCTFRDVEDEAFAKLEPPSEGWAIIKDCGEWPCTAPENVVLNFEGTRYSGTSPNVKLSDMAVVSALGDEPMYDGCTHKESWNMWSCNNRNLGVLIFESMDEDNEDRSMQPIYIFDEQGDYSNTLNSMMDHMWDGFYTGQVRLSRFPAQIETGKDYTIKMQGIPAANMRFKLHASLGGSKFKIMYPNAGSYTVKVNGNAIPYTAWDEEAGRPGELTKQKGCGENRFVGIENFLEFYITAGCELTIEPRDSI
jgi:hypothetical protein